MQDTGQTPYNHLSLWINRLIRRWEACHAGIDTCWAVLYSRLLGIQLGRQCCFFGRPLLRRFEGSTIVLGDGCAFRSALRWTGQAGISRPTTIQTLRREACIRIGPQCGFSGTVIAAAQSIDLGTHVLCGANTTITDTDWHHVEPERRSDPLAPTAPIRIEDNVWLGAGVIVLKGVAIGRDTVVGAGSVVTRDLPAGVLAAGQPAQVVSRLLR